MTVGIPAFNAAATLRRAVESVLGQSCHDILVHISDDCSTDETAEVGRALAASDPRVVFTRQPANLNHHGNFRFLVQAAETPYFMWLPGDDYLEPPYIERALAALDNDPSIASCVCRVRFVSPNGGTKIAEGTYPLMRDVGSNLATYLSNPSDNSRLFALHRTAVVQRAFPRDDFLIAYDWAAMAGTLLFGKHAELQDILMIRDETPVRAYMNMIRKVPERLRWDGVSRHHV